MAITSLKYPSYLENETLPLKQRMIKDTIDNLELGLAKVSLVIAEYVCLANQIETHAMIAFFKSKIPPERITYMKEMIPEASACLDDSVTMETTILPNSFALKISAERRLVALTTVFFGYRNRLFINSLPTDQQKKLEKEPNSEYYDFLGRIEGVSIIERCNALIDKRLCHTYVFGHHDWYHTINHNNILLTHPVKVLEFLTSKGYKKSKKPKPLQVVVYHTPNTTQHFAKVTEVDPQNGVIVTSKFGLQHIYKHKISLAQYHYGNCVTFLDPPV